jgi:hypothetical protein
MGLEEEADSVVLDAVPLAKTRDGALYAVSWNEPSFGVGGAVWLVEATRDRASNLTPSGAASSAIFGYGIVVLSRAPTIYPELVIVSKGFKAEGGPAEAEESCVKKQGSLYRPTQCPAACHRNLNQSND